MKTNELESDSAPAADVLIAALAIVLAEQSALDPKDPRNWSEQDAEEAKLQF
jgi:hypothetical protein